MFSEGPRRARYLLGALLLIATGGCSDAPGEAGHSEGSEDANAVNDAFEGDPGALVTSWPALGDGEAAVLFGGDVLFTDRYAKRSADGEGEAFAGLLPLFESAGAVAFVVNQEGAITHRTEPWPPNDKYNYGVHPETVRLAAAAGFTHVSLANNHALDRGVAGLNDTIANLAMGGIESFGGGDLSKNAFAPTIIDAEGTRVAVLGLMQDYRSLEDAGWRATDARAGIALWTDAMTRDAIGKASGEADVVIAFPHWGVNYAPVSERQREMAGLLVDSGVDAIIGHGGHAAQALGRGDDVPIVWGLGNLLFGTPGRFGVDGEDEGYGLLARVVVSGGAIDRVEVIPIRVNNRLVDFRPQPCETGTARELLRSLAIEGGSALELRGGVGVLSLR